MDEEEMEGRLLSLRLAVAGLLASQSDGGRAAIEQCVVNTNAVMDDIVRDRRRNRVLTAMNEETQKLWSLVQQSKA